MKANLTLILIFLSLSIFSQDIEGGIDKGNFRFKEIKSPYENEIEGNPFIFKNKMTNVYGENDQLLGSYILSYDGYNDNFIVKIGDEIGVFPKENSLIKYFRANSKKYEHVDFYHNGTRYSSLMMVNSEGKDLTLYTKHNVILDGARKGNGITASKKRNYKIKKDSYFYVKSGDDVAKKIPKNLDKFLAIFGDKKELIKAYIKENKLKIKKIDHLIKAFDYYKSIK